jgi:8-oxo-dGTP pyrophosphatase MutT (NUDIX family)
VHPYQHRAASAVPTHKKGFGAASMIVLSDDFRAFLAMYDIEKSTKGYERIAVPGGRKDNEEDYGALETAIREAEEEGGHRFLPNEPIQIPWKRTFPDRTTHDYFAAILPTGTRLRDSGTHEPSEDGHGTILVLGPPRWFSLETYLRLPNKDGNPSTEQFLHYTHLQGICEALMFLYAKKLGKRLPKFNDAWSVIGSQVSALRSNWSKDRS